MNTVYFLAKTRELVQQIKNSGSHSKESLQGEVESLASDIVNPTLVCLRELVEVGSAAGLDMSSVESRFIEVDYFE